MGWFGRFSAAGFVVLAGLWAIDIFATGLWPYSSVWTGIVALIAGIGAVALYYGNDPTAEEYTETTTEAGR
ncbi:hypothetical protein [Halobellus sp. GM3]|uniref:hypothetical protein n=1 Tax=Halobellus sp. GM3 TaxID=3458410 RepID=UPI00403DA7F9